ncbi:MAG: 4-(cytidine 5'-diphospho)-2-C-methyl-D-erythritol kinase [Coriobacteriia bacterium]|nr:4-(cytidine 5'-diphospho)-2-C-methyl-D-erythritol kinase [Coriobacteriia bacterium]
MPQQNDGRTVVRAPAKVNLYLAVGERREDGYHNVETVLQTISLSDEVVLEDAPELSVTTEPDLDLPAEENLAYRAARALGLAMDRDPEVAIHIVKRIPAQAGLGGASTDAAAVLLGLAHRWGLGADALPRLTEVAATLGADVPFFLGAGTALLTGRGDVLDRVLPTPALDLAIVRPPVPVPTGAAYAAFDRMPSETVPGPAALVSACETGDPARVADALFNNMTAASVGLVPEVGDALAFLQDEPGVLGAAMAGSGSAVFAVCDSAGAAHDVVVRASARGLWGATARTVAAGVTVTEGE